MTNDIMAFWPLQSPPRKNQIKALKWLETQTAKYIILEAPVGCHAKGTFILMYDGSLKKVEDIKINDNLMGPDSTSRTVLNLHQGKQMMYRISPTKGDSFIVNEDHILSLKTTNEGKKYGFTSNEIINISVKEYLSKSNYFKQNTKLYRTGSISFPQPKKLPIDPYILGLILGDGCICNSISVTTADKEIYESLLEEAKLRNLQLTESGKINKAKSYYFSTGCRGGDISTRPINSILKDIKDLGLYGKKSYDKFIPDIYKNSTIENRLQILAGLLDTDGYYQNGFTYCTKSPFLADDVKFISRSLGFSANHYIRKVDGKEYFDISISGDLSKIPTRIPKKQASVRKQKKRVNVTSFLLEKLKIDNYYGFEVDKDNLYVMGDFTVTHNSGKSCIGLTYSRFLSADGSGNSFILTPQRILQEQYENTLGKYNLFSVYGKSNYTCGKRNTTCDIGSLFKSKCPSCPARLAIESAKSSSNTVLNYKLALLHFYHTDIFPKRSLMILDECHSAEEHLTELNTVAVYANKAKKFKVANWQIKTTLKEACDWIKENYVPGVENYLNSTKDEYEDIRYRADMHENINSNELKFLKERETIEEHLGDLQRILSLTDQELQSNFVLVFDKEMMKFKMLSGAENFNTILKPKADRFLFMSSTILDHKEFCRDLGIDPKDAAFLSLDSEFPVQNRPIIYLPQMKMNVSWDKPEQRKAREKLIDRMSEILEIHKGESGIVHTGNFKIAQWLVDELEFNAPHELLHHNPGSGDNRNKIINQFSNNHKPALLISPSITEGLDLVDDSARFAIFVKVPFGNLGDQWVKKRLDMSKKWYQRQAIINIIQGGGRIVRSNTDWGYTYILDASFTYLLQQTRYAIPQWWLDSFNK